ncbi:MAG: 4-diphosphocytidyl-2C-methyl-D-erythritol kinase, partial [Proteobacteria bacterium]|nr:4-diphosphocytidyl-2C-methyl-D-erythritol kinase [Pseudomonadota bacterium]
MKFASVKLNKAMGHILAHSVSLESGVLKKGITLDGPELEKLRVSGHDHVTVAMLENGDIAENKAAEILANGFLGAGIKVIRPFAGRVNLVADYDGVFTLNPSSIDGFN